MSDTYLPTGLERRPMPQGLKRSARKPLALKRARYVDDPWPLFFAVLSV